MQVDEKGGIAPMIIACAVYRLALSLWVGGIALFTFVVPPVIFREGTALVVAYETFRR
jgi:hypothetical protein